MPPTRPGAFQKTTAVMVKIKKQFVIRQFLNFSNLYHSFWMNHNMYIMIIGNTFVMIGNLSIKSFIWNEPMNG